MKSYMIPAFFIVEAESIEHAELLAGEQQCLVNDNWPTSLLLDEELRTVEIQLPYREAIGCTT